MMHGLHRYLRSRHALLDQTKVNIAFDLGMTEAEQRSTMVVFEAALEVAKRVERDGMVVMWRSWQKGKANIRSDQVCRQPSDFRSPFEGMDA